MEKLKDKILDMKEDKNIFKEYIKCLCDSEKANEILLNNKNFESLKKYSNKLKED